MPRNTLIAITAILLCASSSYAQEKPKSATYEISVTPPNWKPGKDFPYVVQNLSSGKIENSGIIKTIFDTNTFSFESVKSGFNFEQTHTKKGESLSLGDQWTVRHNTAPNQSCGSIGAQDYKAEVTDVGLIKILVDGKETEVDKITVLVKGSWTHCAFSGSSIRTTIYSKQLSMLISNEQVTYAGGSVVSGSRMLIKEVKTN